MREHLTAREETLALTATLDEDLRTGLSLVERSMLDFEAQFWKYAGAKERAIRTLFDLTPTRYYQRLNVLIGKPEAAAYDPHTVRRLVARRSGLGHGVG